MDLEVIIQDVLNKQQAYQDAREVLRAAMLKTLSPLSTEQLTAISDAALALVESRGGN